MPRAGLELALDAVPQSASAARAALRDLILTLADCKRVLGLRYSDKMLGAPTLEAGIAATPMVVVYRMNPASYAMAKRLVKVPHIALANLVADERLAPEFVQDEAIPERLAPALIELLDEGSPARRRMLAGFERIRDLLGKGGAADRVAEMAASLLAARARS
ncbi:MAG: hypothetical protein KY464_18660 [Gemmatimonadetes bacterium]|nr:hypothetical protein [Gemmatimonadota bacterium]